MDGQIIVEEGRFTNDFLDCVAHKLSDIFHPSIYNIPHFLKIEGLYTMHPR